MYICCIMFANALFYEQEQSYWVQDIVASFTISLFGFGPKLAVTYLFTTSKPRKVDLEPKQQRSMKTRSRGQSIGRQRAPSRDQHAKFVEARKMRKELYNKWYPRP